MNLTEIQNITYVVPVGSSGNCRSLSTFSEHVVFRGANRAAPCYAATRDTLYRSTESSQQPRERWDEISSAHAQDRTFKPKVV
jgi:hypothetical protein